jgi:HSP20 family protein
MRRRDRDRDDERQEEESNYRLGRSMGPSSMRGGGRQRRRRWRRRWNSMMPYSDSSSFGLAPEDWFREFDEIKHQMERVFEETIQDIEKVPKELVREYKTAAGGRAREIGPLVYGYSYTVGADGKPQFREFGNVRPSQWSLKEGGGGGRPGVDASMLITAERESLADVITTDKEVKVAVEMPGITKQGIKVSAYEGTVEVSTTEKAKRKYHRIIDLPPETNRETAKSTYSNGILEITFDKKAKPKAREIKVD